MKKNTLKLHLEALDKKRVSLLEKLIPLLHQEDFVLGGGTALALQLGHRVSVDFDFFSHKKIPANLAQNVSNKIKIQTVSVDTSDELTLFTKDNIKVTFLNYPFPVFSDTVTLKNGLKIFKIKDIATQKAYTIGRRGEYRDYFDLYTILKKKQITLEKIISLAKKVYGSLFNPKLFLQQLVYFKDLKNFELIRPQGRIVSTPKQVKTFLATQVKNYLNKQ